MTYDEARQFLIDYDAGSFEQVRPGPDEIWEHRWRQERVDNFRETLAEARMIYAEGPPKQTRTREGADWLDILQAVVNTLVEMDTNQQLTQQHFLSLETVLSIGDAAGVNEDTLRRYLNDFLPEYAKGKKGRPPAVVPPVHLTVPVKNKA